jgi:hypothetical protein
MPAVAQGVAWHQPRCVWSRVGVRLADRIRWHRERADALLVKMKKLGDIE